MTIGAAPEASPGGKKSRVYALLTAMLLTAAALLFSFFGITRSLRHDECCSVEIADTDWSGIIANLKVNAHTPPLYYFLLNLWMKFFGTGEEAVRSLSGIFYLLSIAGVYLLGKTLFDRRTGLLGAFLFMVSPIAIWHAQDGRMYSLLALLGVLSTFFFFRVFFLKTVRRLDFFFYVLVNIAGTFTHYWFFFILLAQAGAYFLLFRKNYPVRFLSATAVSILPFFVLWSSVLLMQLANGGTSWMTHPGPGALISSYLVFYGGKMPGLMVYTAVAALIFFDFQLWKVHQRPLAPIKQFLSEKTGPALILLATISLLVPFFVSQITPIYAEDRYTIVALAPVALLLGGLVGRSGNRMLVLIFVLALLTAVSAGFIKRRTNPAVVTFRSLAGLVVQNGSDGDLMLLSTSSRSGMDYYLARMQRQRRFIKFSFPAEMAQHPCWLNVARAARDKTWLTEDAEKLLIDLDSLMRGENRLWLIRGHYTFVDDFIQNALDGRFQRDEEGIPAVFDRSVIRYKKRPAF